MKKEDLTQVKHIGAARMKSLNNSGIRTIKQLYDTPLEKLVEVETIGPYHAKLIKAALTKSYKEKPAKSAPKTVSGQKKKTAAKNQDLRKQIKVLNKRLARANENLKPLGKKKYLELYIDVKKRSKRLKNRLRTLGQTQGDLSGKVTNNIIKKADALNATLKNVGKKEKKKKYKKISQEIQSFSKMLKKTGA
jgi:uncharacterized FlaG/YvyC family protein